jgi:hypothetical protein
MASAASSSRSSAFQAHHPPPPPTSFVPQRIQLARQFSESSQSVASHRLSCGHTDASHGGATAESAQTRRPLLSGAQDGHSARTHHRMSAGPAADEFGAQPRARRRKHWVSWQEDAHRRRRQLVTARTVLEFIIGTSLSFVALAPCQVDFRL